MTRTLHNLLRIAIALVMFLIPFRPLYGSYTLIVLSAVALAYAVYNRKVEKPPLLLYFLAALYAVRVIWLLLAEDKIYGLKVLETELPLLAVPLIFSMFPV